MTPETPSVEDVAASLSATSRAALAFLDPTEARSPYDLKQRGQRGGFTTLESLERRKLVTECGERIGRMFAPHTTYKYRLTPLGLAVRNHLITNKESSPS